MSSEAENEVQSQGNQTAKFKISVDNLQALSKLVAFEGDMVDTNEEGRKRAPLFLEFGGIVKKTPPPESLSDDDNEESDETREWNGGVIDLLMSNKSQNVCGRLQFKIQDIEREGLIWCGDTSEFKKFCNGIRMKGDVVVEFGGNITFFTKDVELEMRNDDINDLQYYKNAKAMWKLFKIEEDKWSYKNKVLDTIINMEVSDLVPVVEDSKILGQMFYPITVSKIETGESESGETESVTIQIPFGDSLISMEFNKYTDENQAIALVDEIKIGEIVKLVGQN